MVMWYRYTRAVCGDEVVVFLCGVGWQGMAMSSSLYQESHIIRLDKGFKDGGLEREREG